MSSKLKSATYYICKSSIDEDALFVACLVEGLWFVCGCKDAIVINEEDVIRRISLNKLTCH